MNNLDVNLCFGRWNNLKSRLIRWITGGEWSHAWISYYSPRWGQRMVVHSDSKGVIVESYFNFCKRRGVPEKVSEFKVIDSKADVKNAFAESNVYLGKKYGHLVLLLNSLILLLMKVGFKFSKGAKDADMYTCAEFVTLFIQHTKIPCDLEAEYVWPSKLVSWLENHPSSFKKVL